MAPPHASKRFLSITFWTFFDRMDPAHSMANPVCIKKTRVAAKMMKKTIGTGKLR